MKKTILSLVVLTVSSMAQNPAPSTVVSAADMKDFVEALPHDANSDRPVRVVDVGGYRVGIYGVFRPKSVNVDPVYHKTKVTEVYYILDGAGALVTGGKIMDAKEMPSSIGVTNVRGPKLEGGTARRVTKGDVVVIPGGTPHWFSELDGDITYMIVRTDPANELALK
jgi:mannose-6-phosphate isomerase-like protein (cupin superfamily)